MAAIVHFLVGPGRDGQGGDFVQNFIRRDRGEIFFGIAIAGLHERGAGNAANDVQFIGRGGGADADVSVGIDDQAQSTAAAIDDLKGSIESGAAGDRAALERPEAAASVRAFEAEFDVAIVLDFQFAAGTRGADADTAVGSNEKLIGGGGGKIGVGGIGPNEGPGVICLGAMTGGEGKVSGGIIQAARDGGVRGI